MRVGIKLSRRFALYVSETQEQADKHVQSIAGFLELIGVERAVNVYGHSRGWRRNQIRTADGFNVAALGLDTASRGVKLDQYRPDLIVADDVDRHGDTERTVEKKIAALTTAIIPAGSVDCAVLVVQNLVHEEGIVARLVDGRADFLRDREPAIVEPAVRGLRVEPVRGDDALSTYRITAGEATWAGQDLATCERQINAWGLAAFLREAQHEVAGASGIFFDTSRLNYIDATDLPELKRRCRAWDLAATEGGGDFTAGPLLATNGIPPEAPVYILDLRYGQWGTDRVRREIGEAAEQDGPGTILRLPQDPGQAGKDQRLQLERQFAKFRPRIKPVTGDKATRARGFQDAVNRGNVYVVRADWNFALREQLRKFRDDVTDQADDVVDSLSDGFAELAAKRTHYFGKP